MKVNEPNTFSARHIDTNVYSPEGKSAFEMIFQERWSRTHAILIRLVGDTDEAEDLAVEVFLRLYDRIEGLRSLDGIGGWLYRAAVNLGLNAIRGRKRRADYERQGQLELWNPDSDPSREVERAETQIQVRQILAEMKPEAARLLALRSSGLSYQEISEATGIPVHSIGKMLSRAEQKFEKDYLARFGEPK